MDADEWVDGLSIPGFLALWSYFRKYLFVRHFESPNLFSSQEELLVSLLSLSPVSWEVALCGQQGH